MEATLKRYVWLYNRQLPQSALGNKTPLQAIKERCRTNPQLFIKHPCCLAGYDKQEAEMQIKEIEAEGLIRSYNVIISKEELSVKLDAKIREVQPDVSLKGFRPGKVPASHIRKMFGQSIMKDIVGDVMNESSQKVINDNRIRPAAQPKIALRVSGEEVTRGEVDLEYRLKVEMIPEFEPVAPDTLKLTRLKSEVKDEDVAERLEMWAREQKVYKKKAKTAKAEEEDAVLINFIGRIDGKQFDGGSVEEHELVLGSGSFIPGFEDQLIGKKAGEKLDGIVTFPDNYDSRALAGKKAVFETEILEVRGARSAEIDDGLAGKLGMESLEELSGTIREQLGSKYEIQSRMKLKRAILDDLDSKHTFDLPPGMVEQEFDAIWQDVQAEKEQGLLDEEDAAKSDEKLEADYRKIAERRVRLGLVLAEIGQKADVQVSSDELQSAVINEARRYPGQETQVIEFYQKNPQAAAQLRAPIYEEKVVDLIIEKADITDKNVSKEKLFEEDLVI